LAATQTPTTRQKPPAPEAAASKLVRKRKPSTGSALSGEFRFKAVYFLRGSRSALSRAGAAIALCAVAASLASSAPVKLPPEAGLYSFQGGSDGRNHPVAGLITDRSGALYGITQLGGTFSNPNCLNGYGTVFKLTPPSVGQTQWSYNVGSRAKATALFLKLA
jgi:hypothetical protein